MRIQDKPGITGLNDVNKQQETRTTISSEIMTSRTKNAQKAARSDTINNDPDARAPEADANVHLITTDDAKIELPEYAQVTFAEGLGKILANTERHIAPETNLIWRGIESRYAEIDPRLAAVNERNERFRAENPEWDGSATYGDAGVSGYVDVENSELFAFNGADADQIYQGYLGDCYFLAALSSVAMEDPSIIEDMIEGPDSDGNYYVTFYDIENDGEDTTKPTGETVTFKVSAEVLAFATEEGQGVVGAQIFDLDGDGKPEIGINIIEKAFVQYVEYLHEKGVGVDINANGMELMGDNEATGYNAIEGGFSDSAYQALTGQNTFYENIDDLSNQELFNYLSAANVGEGIMVGSNPDAEMSGIVPGHAYTVLGTFEDENGNEFVALRNPWGSVEPGNDGSDDGMFVLSLDDFKQNFDQIMGDENAASIGASAGPENFTDLASAISHFVNQAWGQNASGGNTWVDPAISDVASDIIDQVPSPDNPAPAPGSDDNESIDTTTWEGYIEDIVGANPDMVDVNSLVQSVLREAYVQNTEDLKHYASKVSFYNEVKSMMREFVSELRNLRGSLGDANISSLTTAQKNELKSIVNTEQESTYYNLLPEGMQFKEWLNTDEAKGMSLDEAIEHWDSQLQAIGDDAQLANIDLQNMLQKQQQTVQMLSNISKILHDTATAVIRKIG